MKTINNQKMYANSYIYRVDKFLSENSRSFGLRTNYAGSGYGCIGDNDCLIFKENIYRLQYGVPYLDIQTDISTFVDNSGCTVSKNSHKIIINKHEIYLAGEANLKNAHITLSKFHSELTNYPVKPITKRDHLVFSLYRRIIDYLKPFLENDKHVRMGTKYNRLYDFNKLIQFPGIGYINRLSFFIDDIEIEDTKLVIDKEYILALEESKAKELHFLLDDIFNLYEIEE